MPTKPGPRARKRPDASPVMGQENPPPGEAWTWKEEGALLTLVLAAQGSKAPSEFARISPARDRDGYWVWLGQTGSWRFCCWQPTLTQAKQAATVAVWDSKGVLGLPMS